MSFLKDKEYGRIGENLLISKLNDAGFDIVNPEKHERSFWDVGIKIKKNHIFFEVKYDLYALKSGNIAFEYFNSKKAAYSGIMMTQADFWCHIIPETTPRILICDTKILVDMVAYHLRLNLAQFPSEARNKKIFKKVFNAGDDNADLALYKISEIEDLFIDLNKISNKEIKKYFTEYECQ